jgi:catechol-2,3-dioxygenase
MKQLAINPGKPDSTADLAKPGGAVGETIMANQETNRPRVMGVGHAALSARDPVGLAEFYRDVLGLQVVPTESSDLGENVFLSSHAAEVSVDLALFANPAYQHTAFEVRSLADLRAFHQRVLDRSVPVKMALNHGVSLSFYFDDPEGHLIEVYWSTGIDCLPRHGDPIDLTLPEEALRRDVLEATAR